MNRLPLVLALLLAAPAGARAQVATGAPDTTAVDADPSGVTSYARAAQASFERSRIRHLPARWASTGGECDEIVGRFCTWYDGSDWYPEEPEAPEIGALRAALLATLDSVWGTVPGNAWVLGQRVWYRVESGDRGGALAVARDCRGAERWWCAALEGFALHGLARYAEAADAFTESLAAMDAERASAWRVPLDAVDRDAREALQALEDASPDSTHRVLRRLWLLADPLYLVDGNDRETAHYARWTLAAIRHGGRTPFGRWGRDLEELTVRNGWEVAWERALVHGSITGREQVVAHKHPEGREYMPPGRALRDPTSSRAVDLTPDITRPRSLYAPDYAPALLPMEGQLAVFPRGERMVVVATHFVPRDTSRHADHDHARPWLDAGDQAGEPDRAGLYLVPRDGLPIGVTSVGVSEGALMSHAPAGAYLVSIEAWSPERRRAGRWRQGLDVAPAPDDVATLSDILLVSSGTEVTGLEAAVPRALPRAEVRPDQDFAIVWEVAGLGFRPETLAFQVSVSRTGRGVLGRIGDFLRITSPPEPLDLSWEEPSPLEPEILFRYLDLVLPELAPGAYEIELTLKTEGRADATTRATFQVVDPSDEGGRDPSPAVGGHDHAWPPPHPGGRRKPRRPGEANAPAKGVPSIPDRRP